MVCESYKDGDIVGVYLINGDDISTVYDMWGDNLVQCYDIDGNALLSGRTFDDNTTITDIYTSALTAYPQGGCVDDNGNLCVIFPTVGKFIKHNINNGTNTEISFTPDAYGHGNGMTYNPNTGYFYVASMSSTGEVYVFDSSFNLIDTVYARDGNDNIFNCWNIAYDRIAERFITISSENGGIIYYMDDDFNYISSVAFNATLWGYTRQDIETDGVFIYCLSYNSNHIYVFDMLGNLIIDISNSAFIGEPESLCYDWENDVYYIEGRDSYFVIRQAEFFEQ